jgi:hypothetical protein
MEANQSCARTMVGTPYYFSPELVQVSGMGEGWEAGWEGQMQMHGDAVPDVLVYIRHWCHWPKFVICPGVGWWRLRQRSHQWAP